MEKSSTDSVADTSDSGSVHTTVPADSNLFIKPIVLSTLFVSISAPLRAGMFIRGYLFRLIPASLFLPFSYPLQCCHPLQTLFLQSAVSSNPRVRSTSSRHEAMYFVFPRASARSKPRLQFESINFWRSS